MAGTNLPACTKYAQTLQGCPGRFPRAPMQDATDEQKRSIEEGLALLGALDG